MKKFSKRNYKPSRGVVCLITAVILILACGIWALSRKADAEVELVRQIRIPVLCGYTGQYWVDQHGERMHAEQAEEYLYDHPVFGVRIVNLNREESMLYGLSNPNRNDKLSQLEISIINCSQGNWDPAEEYSYITAFHDIVQNGQHVETLKSFCNDEDSSATRTAMSLIEHMEWPLFVSGSGTENFDGNSYARHIFYGKLAEFIDDGIFAELCADNPHLGESIPVIAASNGQDWYDQNGVIMPTTDAHEFLRNHQRYARGIIALNNNSHYAPELITEQRSQQLESFRRSIATDSVFDDSNHDLYDYGYIVEDMQGDSELVTTLQSFSDGLNGNCACYDIDNLIDIINNAPQLNRVYAWERDFTDYVYWGTLAKMANSGIYHKLAKPPVKNPPIN